MGLGSVLGEMADMVAVMFNKLRDGGNKLLDPIIRDGTVPAFFRQGADEIGMALKAFPDSVHAEEPGTVLNPTQGEIAARRSRGGVYGRGNPDLPSPSEVAKDKRPHVAEQHQHGQERGHER